jgi:hypothetical protein
LAEDLLEKPKLLCMPLKIDAMRSSCVVLRLNLIVNEVTL